MIYKGKVKKMTGEGGQKPRLASNGYFQASRIRLCSVRRVPVNISKNCNQNTTWPTPDLARRFG
jgi:hypothetical protein